MKKAAKKKMRQLWDEFANPFMAKLTVADTVLGELGDTAFILPQLNTDQLIEITHREFMETVAAVMRSLRCHFMCSRMQMVLHIMAAQSTFKYLAESMDYLYTA